MTRCGQCGRTPGETPLKLQGKGYRALFCSFECLITYSVDRIQQRLRRRAHQFDVTHGIQRSCARGSNALRPRRISSDQ